MLMIWNIFTVIRVFEKILFSVVVNKIEILQTSKYQFLIYQQNYLYLDIFTAV